METRCQSPLHRGRPSAWREEERVSRQLHIVSHSHWDREWYQTFQQFRLRLVQLLDGVLDLLATGTCHSFMLDGQTIMLQDYVEIRPERRQELRERIAAGTLLIGPWYVHPDEFLVSGEALVRNLLQGARDCAEWGARMAIGYVPDQFGHIAQLPQIWRGFGITTTVLWRGVDPAETGTACTWRGLDGSSVLALILPDGYNHAEHLPAGGQALAERLRALAAAQEPLAAPDQPILIMHGGDHALPDPRPLLALPAAQAAIGDTYDLRQSSLPRFAAQLANRTTGVLIRDELRNSRAAPLLSGVTSARMCIKQRNAAAQILLERQAEPLSVVAAALGAPHRGPEIRQSWRYLLQNQPHDSIAGCGIDQVHREMHTRFDWCEQIATAIRDDALCALAAHIDSALPGAEDPRALVVTIFNGAIADQRGRVSLAVRLVGEVTSYELVDDEGQPVPHCWEGEHGEPPSTFNLPIVDAPDQETVLAQVTGDRIMGMGVQALSMRTSGETLHVEITVGDQTILTRAGIVQAMHDAYTLIEEAHCTQVSATIYRSAEARLTALTPRVPAFGYRTLLLRPRAERAPSGHAPVEEQAGLPVIENARYHVEADVATGALTITERVTGARLGPANVFLDDGEAGDLYTHAAPPLDRVVRASGTPRIERTVGPLGQTLRIDHVIHAPVALAESRFERADQMVPVPITTEVSLIPDDPLVRFHTTVTNGARDHRLRMYVTAPFATDHAHVADAFAVLRRAAQPATAGTWAEQPTGAAPHQGVVAIHDSGGCCLLATKGLPEYEVVPQEDGTTQLALTLLRCTGWLSRSDIPARPGDAGPPLPTPEAQCPGTHTFDYAIATGAGPWQDLLPAAQAFGVDLCATTTPCREGNLPPAAALVEVMPTDVVISALKEAEDGRGAILRLVNQGDQERTAHVHLLMPVARATLVDLAEHNGDVVYAGSAQSKFSVQAHAHGIVSVRLEWAQG